MHRCLISKEKKSFSCMMSRCNMWGRLPWCYANFGITSWVPMMLCQLISIVMEWYTAICSHACSHSSSHLNKWLQARLQARLQLLLLCCYHVVDMIFCHLMLVVGLVVRLVVVYININDYKHDYKHNYKPNYKLQCMIVVISMMLPWYFAIWCW